MVTRYNLGYGAAGANPMIARVPSAQAQTMQPQTLGAPSTPSTPNWQTMRQQNQDAMQQYRQTQQQYNRNMSQYNRDLRAYNNQDFTPQGTTNNQYGGLLGANNQIVNRAVYDPNDPASMAAFQQQGAVGGGNIGQYFVNRGGQQGFSSTNLAMPTAPTAPTMQRPQMLDWKAARDAMKPDFNRPRRDVRMGGGLLGGATQQTQQFNPQANNDLMARLQGASDFGAGNLGTWRNGALAGSSFGYDLANSANRLGMDAAAYDKMINPDTYQNRWGAGGQWIGGREGTTQNPLAQLQGTQTPTQQQQGQAQPMTVDPLTGLAKLVTDKANGTWRR